MSYAVFENGKIQVYGVLPQTYKSQVSTVLGGFNNLSNEELEKHGFYPIEHPQVNTQTQQRGNIYFDKDKKVFTYRVNTKELPSVESLKNNKINQIERQKTSLLERTKEIVFEALELGEEIPTEIKEERASIRKQYEEIKKEINSLDTSESLLDYNNTIKINTTI